jgi:hypothetical protein
MNEGMRLCSTRQLFTCIHSVAAGWASPLSLSLQLRMLNRVVEEQGGVESKLISFGQPVVGEKICVIRSLFNRSTKCGMKTSSAFS